MTAVAASADPRLHAVAYFQTQFAWGMCVTVTVTANLFEVVCEWQGEVAVATVELQQVSTAAACDIHSPVEHVLTHTPIGLGEAASNLQPANTAAAVCTHILTETLNMIAQQQKQKQQHGGACSHCGVLTTKGAHK